MKNRKKITKEPRKIRYVPVISVLTIVILLLMTIGYSALQQILNINATASIDNSEYSIVIKSITASSTENGAYENSTPTFNNTEGAMYSSLPNLNSSIIYTIKIKNVGRTSGVLDYTFVSSDNSQVKYKIGGINNGSILAAGESVDVTVEFEYWDDVTSINSNTVSSLINFEFVPYSDSYSNACTSSWDGSSSSEPSRRTVYGVEYYEISNANELNWFTSTVNNGSTGINAILTNNICLNSQTMSQIGASDYTGTFDGQNRTIEGFYTNRDTVLSKTTTSFYVGLFKKNSGHITNLNISGSIYERLELTTGTSNDYNAYDYVGALVSENNGKISNCSSSVTVETRFTLRTTCYVNRPTQEAYVGGLVGVNGGVITGSYNKGVISMAANNRKNACNYDANQNGYFGGITAKNSGYISDSYNNNNLVVDGSVAGWGSYSYLRVGGLVGDFTSGNMKNSYNSGALSYSISVENRGELKESSLGGAVGLSSGTLSNVYYLDSVGYTGSGTSVTANDLSNLNVSLGNYYYKDSRSINGGYPILKWQR